MSTKNRPQRLGRGLNTLMAPGIRLHPVGNAHVPGPPGNIAPIPGIAPGQGQEGSDTSAGSPQTPAAHTTTTVTSASSTALTADAASLTYLAVAVIRPNPHQPRQNFSAASIETLAASIKADGLMQPIIVRAREPKNGQEKSYELVAGERRWRAAKEAGLTHVPALVRHLTDRQLAEWALIENLQREDLNPMERAHAFRGLVERFQLSHDDIAQRVGVDRSTITNTLRLLNLHEDLQQLLRAGQLSSSQARALVGLTDLKQQLLLAKQAISQEWSVRKLEAAVRLAQKAQQQPSSPPSTVSRRTAHLEDIEQQISQQLLTRVRISPGRKKGTGTLAIEFHSIDQFDALLGRLGVHTDES